MEDEHIGSPGPENDETMTESQREWETWSASGYRKAFQPRSVLRIEFFVALLLVAFVVSLIWAAKHHP